MLQHITRKQAIVITALVIVLCLIGLVVATVIIFTHDRNDGTIGVISTEDVEVDIVDDSAENSLVGKVLYFQSLSEGTEVLFEPGGGFYTQGFKVKNIGNTPLIYRLFVSEDDQMDMEGFHDAFEVWISTSPTVSADSQKLTEFEGQLTAGACSESTYYLFVRMRESAGNEFQDMAYSGIGVTVYAAQSIPQDEE